MPNLRYIFTQEIVECKPVVLGSRACYWRPKIEKRLLLFKNSLGFQTVKETKVVVLLVLLITL